MKQPVIQELRQHLMKLPLLLLANIFLDSQENLGHLVIVCRLAMGEQRSNARMRFGNTMQITAEKEPDVIVPSLHKLGYSCLKHRIWEGGLVID